MDKVSQLWDSARQGVDMEEHEEFRLRWIEPDKAHSPEAREGTAVVDLDVAPDLIIDAMLATSGAQELIEKEPRLANVDSWKEAAYFSVCQKRGSAHFLDFSDCDAYDGLSDMQLSLRNCRVWFSGRDTRTGRIDCAFYAPGDGKYRFTASLQSDPASAQASVECLIDDKSFGPLSILGTIHQPHLTILKRGKHAFRIRQRFGSFFFLAVRVDRFFPQVFA
jgi:hypothetical protein